MEIDRIGERLLEACGTAREELVLCAPFIKESVIHRLLSSAAWDLKVEVFTRWRPDEVAAGVSDTAVLSIATARGAKVFLCDRLHAKYIRFDGRAIIGSANLTATALGWTSTPNLEIMTEVPVESRQLVEFERRLRRESVVATQSLADEVNRVAALLPQASVMQNLAFEVEQSQGPVWYPRLREPRDLYTAYAVGLNGLSHTSQTAAGGDLAALQLPVGLSRPQFEALVASRLLQSPVVQGVDRTLADAQRFGAVRDHLAGVLDLDRESASFVWQTLMRWLLEFMPGRYQHSVPRWSEVVVRRDAGETSS